jgi:hypothetical protein
LLSAPLAEADERPWYPVKVVSDGRPAAYTPLPKVNKAWRICALLPHARDRYWWGVSWGLAQEAGRQGVKLGIYQAGGYEHLPEQRKQFQTCLDKRADAILLAAIASDGLDDAIARAARLPERSSDAAARRLRTAGTERANAPGARDRDAVGQRAGLFSRQRRGDRGGGQFQTL